MKFGTDIPGPQRMYAIDFSDPLTFHSAPAGQSFHLSSEMPSHLLNGLRQNYVQIIIVPRRGLP